MNLLKKVFIVALNTYIYFFVLISPTSASVSTFNLITTFGSGTGGTGTSTMESPRGIAIDGSGNMYVAEGSNHRIHKFTSAYVHVAMLGGTSCNTTYFCAPSDVALDSGGNVWVADTSYHRIRKLNNGITSVLLTVGGTTTGTGDGQFDDPNGIAIDASDNVYVADRDNDRIQKFDSSGNFITKWGTSGTGNGQFTNVTDVAVDNDGNIWTIDSLDRKISKFTNTGTFISSFTKASGASTTVNTLNQPTSLKLDSSGNIFVADMNNARIVKLLNDGTWVAAYGGLSTTYGLTIDSSGNFFTTDSNASAPRIRKFDFTGVAYQITNVDSTLDIINQTNGTNYESTGIYGMQGATAIRLKSTNGKTISDLTVTYSADDDWSSVTADSDISTGKSFVSNLISASGATTHTLYVPILPGKTSTTVRLCPDATSLASVTGSCSNGVDRAVGSYTESFGSIVVSQISNLGDSVSYWKITGMTGSGGEAGGYESFSGSGAGTIGDPFQITTCTQLQEMKDDRLSYFQIMNDIDCSATTGWNSGNGFIPVGASTGEPFSGTLTGNVDYQIDSLFIQMTANGVGLFGYTNNATISNVHLTNLHYTKINVSRTDIGGLIGWMDGGTITGSSTSGLIDQTVSGGSTNNAGGLVGTINSGTSTITNCTSTTNISNLAVGNQLGGFVGLARGSSTTISDSHATGYVHTGHTSSVAGGFIGQMLGNTAISNSYATGEVHSGIPDGSSPGDVWNIGGFVGIMGNSSTYTGNTTITDSYSTGNVIGEIQNRISFTLYVWQSGGFVGLMEANSSIDSSYSTGTFSVVIDEDYTNFNTVGGFVGQMRKNQTGNAPTITDSYATGNMSLSYADGGNYAGGFVGVMNTGSITGSYTTADITVAPLYPLGGNGIQDLSYVGGFVGSAQGGTITTSYTTCDIDTSSGPAYYVGGFIARIDTNSTVDISQSYATGNVEGTDYVGGFLGDSNSAPSASIIDAYSRGNAYAYASYADTEVGGFAGESSTLAIQNVYSTGIPSSLNSTIYIGGLIGPGPSWTSSYWDTQTSGYSTGGGGTGLTTSQLKNQANLTNWNFSTIWTINPTVNDGYPSFIPTGGPTPTPSPTPTPAPTSTTTPTPTPTINTGGTNTQCSELPPSTYPNIFEVLRKGNKATLNYSPAGPEQYTYQLMYGYVPGVELFGTTFTAGPATGALSYTVSSLEPKKSYYFWMRVVNDCAPGNWSNTTGGTGTVNSTPTPTPIPSPTPTPPPTEAVTTTITIVDDQGTPLPGVTVDIVPEATAPTPTPILDSETLYSSTLTQVLGAVTDTEGQVEVTLYPDEYEIIVTIGDEKIVQPLTITRESNQSTVAVNVDTPIDQLRINAITVADTAVKVTDVAIKASVATAAVVTTVATVTTTTVAVNTLAPIYTSTARPLIKLPYDLIVSLLQKFWQSLSSFGGTFFGLSFAKKKKKGNVFDGVTTKPVKGVYLIFFSKSGNLKTAYTDQDGQYFVDPVPDDYLVRAEKTDYNFPSKLVTVPQNYQYSHIYLPGELIAIKEFGEVVTDIAVPIDPKTDVSKFSKKKAKIIHSISYALSLLHTPIAIVMIIISGLAAFTGPGVMYKVVFASVTLSYILRFAIKSTKQNNTAIKVDNPLLKINNGV